MLQSAPGVSYIMLLLATCVYASKEKKLLSNGLHNGKHQEMMQLPLGSRPPPCSSVLASRTMQRPRWNTCTVLMGDARYTKSIYALLSCFIVWSLLCYCVRNRDHCCVLCDIAQDLLLAWYIVHQPYLYPDCVWSNLVTNHYTAAQFSH